MQILDYFYTEGQGAEQLGLNRVTLWRWIKAGKLSIQRIGGVVFILKEDIDSLKSTKFETSDNLTLTMAEVELRQAEARLRQAEAELKLSEARLRRAEALKKIKAEASAEA